MWNPQNVDKAVILTLWDSGKNYLSQADRLSANSLSSSRSWTIPITRAVRETRDSFRAARAECAAESCRLLFLSRYFPLSERIRMSDRRRRGCARTVRWLRARPSRADNTDTLRAHTTNTLAMIQDKCQKLHCPLKNKHLSALICGDFQRHV